MVELVVILPKGVKTFFVYFSLNEVDDAKPRIQCLCKIMLQIEKVENANGRSWTVGPMGDLFRQPPYCMPSYSDIDVSKWKLKFFSLHCSKNNGRRCHLAW